LRTHTIRAVTALAAASLALGLGACSSSTATTATSTPAASAAKGSRQAASVTISDPWVKAVDTGMTGAFFVLKNTGSTPVHVVSASSSVSSMMQLHETVMGTSGAMAMQEKKGGFTVAAGGSHEFKPGGDHVMFMGVNAAVKSGTTLTFTLAFEDGSTLPVTAEVRTFAGAKETYVPGATTGTHSMPGMSDTPGMPGMTTGSHG
jgi:copper(I)-binding protein